ncbi:cupin domain-containing protein [Egicoccus sp. AB-alg6-2]|uniref:cupin domain-containing protein n=1 Tax=Egicoccus sp. AB-alg6-2 TaxID=3242692 RepID=UPI00359D44C0
MSLRHLVALATDAQYDTPTIFDGHSEGHTRWDVVGPDRGSVHMGFGICQLDAAGTIDWHLHSFEESFFVLSGEVVVETPEGSFRLVEGDYGVVPVGVPHAWHNDGDQPARWAEMLAPQGRSGDATDTFFVDAPPGRWAPGADAGAGEPQLLDPRDPRCRSFGHFEPHHMEPSQQTQDKLALSASMRTALLVYSGISVKMMVDSDLGAFLATMFMVQYEPGGFAGAHDHPFEEAYLILEGEVETVIDGRTYRLGPGDVAFAGVASTHEFANVGDGPVRWLETQAPQPPGRHSYRFARDWAYLEQQLGHTHDH